MVNKIKELKNHRQDKPPVVFNIVVPGVGLECGEVELPAPHGFSFVKETPGKESTLFSSLLFIFSLSN